MRRGQILKGTDHDKTQQQQSQKDHHHRHRADTGRINGRLLRTYNTIPVDGFLKSTQQWLVPLLASRIK
jgi:hypothetical protein